MLWLFRFVPRKGDFIQPLEVSQKGIAEGLGMRQTNVSRELSALRKEGMIEQSSSHFTGTKRKMTAYFLTPLGLDIAREVVGKVNTSPVMVEIRGKREEMPARDLITILKGRGLSPSGFALAKCFEESDDALGLDEIHEAVSNAQRALDRKDIDGRLKHHLGGTITEGNFIGREAVLERVKELLGAKGCLLMRVLGVAGMGKSALGREAIKHALGSFNVFYFRFRRWDSFDSLVEEILTFLEIKKGRDALEPLLEFCGKNNLLMVLDDVHRLKADVNDFIDELLAYSHKLARLKLLLLSREKTEDEIYSFNKYGKKFTEIMLTPLELPECMELASVKVYGEPGKVDDEIGKKILEATGGIPLLVELLHEEDIISGKVHGKGIGIIENEILKNLGKESARTLKMISLCTLPVEKDIRKESGVSISELESRLLLERTREGLFQVHDHIREIIKGGLGFRERKSLVKDLLVYLKDVIRRGTEGDYLPEPMMEDLDIYFLEYIYHNIELGEVEESLNSIMISPFDITIGPSSKVLEEFLHRMEVKLGGKHGVIELLLGEIALERGEVEKARERVKGAKKIITSGCQEKSEGRDKYTVPINRRLEQLSRRIEETARRPGKLNEMVEKAEGDHAPKDRIRLCLLIAAFLTDRREQKGARKWLLKAENLTADLPEEEKGYNYFKIGAAYFKIGDVRGSHGMAKRGLRASSADEGGMRGPLNKLFGQVFFLKGQYSEAEDRFNRAKVCFRRSENIFQLSDTMLWEVKSILGKAKLLEMAMSATFLERGVVDRRARESLDDCITRIRESLLILGGITRKTGRLSRLLGREIFDPRNVSLWRQLLVLRCSLEWVGGYRDYALETSDSLISLGERTGKTDILLEGTVISSRILIRSGKLAEARKLLKELERKKDIPPCPGRNALEFTLGLIEGNM